MQVSFAACLSARLTSGQAVDTHTTCAVQVVFGPAHDGGFYLIGAKRTEPAMLQARNIHSWHALLVGMLSPSFLPCVCRPGTWLFNMLQHLGRTHVFHACPQCKFLQTLVVGCHCGRFLADAASCKCFKEGGLLPLNVCRPSACRRALRGARRRCWRPRSPRRARAASAWRPGTRCRPCWTSTPERRAGVLMCRAALALRLGVGSGRRIFWTSALYRRDVSLFVFVMLQGLVRKGKGTTWYRCRQESQWQRCFLAGWWVRVDFTADPAGHQNH